MKTIPLFLLLILSAVMAVSCGDRSSASLPEGSDVPLRYAYPRVAVPDTVYSRLQSGPLSFEVNSAAMACASANDRGLDLFYPAYRGKIYLSVNDEMSAERLASAITNRRQSFALNHAGAPAKSSVFVNDAGFVCELTYTDEAIVTPVLFLAHDGRKLLFSGAFAFDALDRRATADSVAPVTAAIRADVMRLLHSLREKN